MTVFWCKYSRAVTVFWCKYSRAVTVFWCKYSRAVTVIVFWCKYNKAVTDVERTRFLRLVLFYDFSLHISRFWVFVSCLIRVGLLEYVRAEGWWSHFGESEEDEGVVFLFTVFFSFFSLPLHFAASFGYCTVSDCSPWTHLDGSWACFFFYFGETCLPVTVWNMTL